MSALSEELDKRLEESRAAVVESQAKILTFDIERIKGRAAVDFWDLGDFKNRRIHADDVIQWPRSICVAWNWYGETKIEFASEWGDGHEGMLQRFWNEINKADIVVGHNIVGFDLKKLNTEWRDAGFTQPAPYKVVDTLKEARKQFGDESKTLDALCKRLGLVGKTDRYDVDTANRAVDGDRKAQIEIQAYNEGDIAATIALYDRLRGWMPNHPHMGELVVDEKRCNQCSSTELEVNGTYLARQIRYIQYQCKTCGGWVRGTTHSRSAVIHGVK